MKRITSITLSLTLVLLLAACNFPFTVNAEEAMATSVAETVEAMESHVVKPTLAPLPTQAPAQPTQEMWDKDGEHDKPGDMDKDKDKDGMQPDEKKQEQEKAQCLFATFVSETIPDGTTFSTGESFTKSWTLRNDGYCDWNTDYHISYKSGDQMSGPGTQDITTETDPGESITISVDLVAPSSAGTYTGYWQFKTDDGVAIGSTLSVKIVVE